MGVLSDELSPALARTQERLAERLGERLRSQPAFRGELTVLLPVDDLLETLRFLRDDEELAYRFLSDVTAVDWLPREPRFEVVYHLFSLATAARLRVKVQVADKDKVPSATALWRGAAFSEREVFDLFGIAFTGHPNLQRILTPDEFQGHPLRKDFAIGDEPVAFDLPYRKQFSDAPD